MESSFTLEARNVSVAVRQSRLLEGVSLTIAPSELVCIMGPSGAGKTTLLTALNGYVRPNTGAVLLNGIDLHANYDRFAGSIGYVPQDDIVHRELTVRQALCYSARLRLGSRCSPREIDSRLSAVLEELSLCDVQGMLIGSPETKNGISGGERKRVNLAMELLTDPSLMFLDEPTSGLSSGDALLVMRLLRRLADTGKTVLITIHQPSLETFRLAHKLVFVAREPERAAHVVYHGPAYPDAVSFFNPDGVPNVPSGVDPPPEAIEAGYRQGCKKHGHCGWINRFHASHYAHDARARSTADCASASPPRRASREAARQSSAAAQCFTLAARAFAVKARDRWNTVILLAQAPIVGLLIDAVFSTRVTGAEARANPLETSRWIAIAIFLLVLSALWFGCSNSVRDIVAERAIYRRERMLGLRISPYLASKFAVLAGLCSLQCAVLLGLVIAGCELQGAWPAMFLLLLLVALVGVGIGLLLSALARTSEAAIAMLPIVLLPMVILGGAMMPVHKMFGAAQVLAQAMPSRWGFEGMLVLESDARDPFVRITKAPQSEGALATATGDWAEDYFPIDVHRFGVEPAFFALLVSLTALARGSYLALLKRTGRLRARRASWDKAKRHPAKAPAPQSAGAAVAPALPASRGRQLLPTAATIMAVLIAVCAYALLPVAAVRSRAGSVARAPDLPPGDSLAGQPPPSNADDSRFANDDALLPAGEDQTPPSADDLVRQAEQERRNGDFAGALATLNRLQRADPGNPYYLALRADCCLSLGDFSQALADAKEAVRLGPDHVFSRYVSAVVHEELGDFKRAQKDADRALELALSGRYDSDSIKILRQKSFAITEKSRRSNELYERGKGFFRKQEYELAISALTEVISLRTISFRPYHYRAVAYERIGEYLSARDDLDTAIALNPRDASLFEARAYVNERMEVHAAALSDVGEAIRLDPGQTKYTNYREKILRRLRAGP